MDLAKVMRVNQLLGFYGGLLTDKQQAMLGLYYEEDFSLAEIADHYDISRQAVRDNLKRAEQILEHYEDQLHLLARREARLALLDQLASHTDEAGQTFLAEIRAMDQ